MSGRHNKTFSNTGLPFCPAATQLSAAGPFALWHPSACPLNWETCAPLSGRRAPPRGPDAAGLPAPGCPLPGGAGGGPGLGRAGPHPVPRIAAQLCGLRAGQGDGARPGLCCYSRDFAHKLARFTLMSRMQSVQMWARMKSAQGRMAFLFSPKIPLFFLYNKIFVEETQWQLRFCVNVVNLHLL